MTKKRVDIVVYRDEARATLQVERIYNELPYLQTLPDLAAGVEGDRERAEAAAVASESSAERSGGYATAADVSRLAAANSASEALASEQNARASEQGVTDAANAAAQSASEALASKNAAASSASGASGSALAAQNSASAAAGSASTATTQATTATTQAGLAATAKTAAETARNTAQTYRNEAEGFKNSASASAIAAAASAAGLAAGPYVSFDEAQSKSEAQKSRARTNLDIDWLRKNTAENTVFSPAMSQYVFVNNSGDWGCYNTLLSQRNPLSVSSGGTGALTAAGARESLGLSKFRQDADTPRIQSGDATWDFRLMPDGRWGAYVGGGTWVPLGVEQGGTGQTTVAGIKSALDVASIQTSGSETQMRSPSVSYYLIMRNDGVWGGHQVGGTWRPLGLGQGGTGGNSAEAAKANLGLSRVFADGSGNSRLMHPTQNKGVFMNSSGGWGAFDFDTSSAIPLPVGQGGTGATTAAAARTSLGLGSLATMSNAPIANGGTGSTNETDARTNLQVPWTPNAARWSVGQINAGSAFTLPSGGTWAWDADSFSSSGNTFAQARRGGVAAGGATVVGAQTGIGYMYRAWRIA